MKNVALRQKDSGSGKRARATVANRRTAKNSNNLLKEQTERRAAIAKVVLHLAEKGGYDAIQLREISRRSGVALRTIYKYFGSREALITSVMTEWRSRILKKAIAAGEGDKFVDRYLSILRYTFDVFRAKPKLFETFARMQLEGEPVDQGVEMDGALLRHEFEDVDEIFFREFGDLIGSLFYTSLMFCVFGKHSFDEAWSRIDRIAHHFARD